MNQMDQITNKMNENLLPRSEIRNQAIMPRHRAWVSLLICLVLAHGWVVLGCVLLVTAHSGFDPEIAEITEMLAKDPDSVDLLIRRGQVYRSYGKFIESLQDLERAWLLDPKNRTVVLQRALTLSAMGRLRCFSSGRVRPETGLCLGRTCEHSYANRAD